VETEMKAWCHYWTRLGFITMWFRYKLHFGGG